MRFRLAGVLAGLALVAAPLHAQKVRNHFDTDTPWRVPGFFDLVVLGAPGRARWLVLTDQNPPSTPHKLAQVETNRPADSIAAAVRRNSAFRDGSVSTFVKGGPGRAGMVLRMADERNFLLLLADTASGETVLTSYRSGKPTELGRGRANLTRRWEKFSVTASGPSVAVLFEDQKLFDASDPQPVSGRSGVATAGPGDASFDEFILEPAEAASQP